MRIVVFGLIVSALSACVAVEDRHGYVMERGETELSATVGVDTKDSVLARYGEPSIRPPLSDDVWYYVTSSSSSRAFYETETTSRNIVLFAFNEDDTVADVMTFDLEDGQDINLVNRVTRTRGKELSFFEQLIGGVGQGAAAIDPDGQ
ncbi:lipoprotein, SmpA/OmlA family protein [Parvularcula bermudensis HTCC2503]|uniref:Lipoprotein, SmpA/OmlA family protein n=1 Tax=Parvularcula bermudensis (strain ATCC BAA-594 / HTCC2503 / KCTC 12087) TaxID=314260 RepID=E0TIB9_PARBH|nr:outer membrane protein assembly factor BamE [Parvularcula bermudensis]ADM09703.1 lipoprotein, SmpA/OmlA family protein [Parvularcula bermudensis HTCC2503]